MKRIHDGMQMVDRLAQGPQEIRGMWNALPATRHNLGNQELWSFDIFPVDISPGVTGVLATVHSEFEEMNSGSGGVIKRSFDRSFTLWTDPAGSIKVASDIMTVRSYAGATAWKVDPNAPVAVPPPAPAAAAPANPEEVGEKHRKCEMLAEKTGLNFKYAEMCLVDTNWDLAAAWNAWMWAKVPPPFSPFSPFPSTYN
jgi:nuclear RNA export factor